MSLVNFAIAGRLLGTRLHSSGIFIKVFMLPKQSAIAKQTLQKKQPMAVRTIELSEPLQPLADLQDYWSVRVFVTFQHAPIGSLDIANEYQSVSVETLAAAIAADTHLRENKDHLLQDFVPELPDHVSVSIIVPTCNRPYELRNCLHHLVNQKTTRKIEIIVIDNCPHSGLTPPVVAEFPGAKLISEPCPGASYARNTGIKHSQGEIIVTLDDDVTPPSQWLEQLIRPLARSEVMVVTGNILPLELETPAQQLFEVYGMGGLGRGYRTFEMDGTQVATIKTAVPVWELGASANAAFRASIFKHPEIGLWEEKLGAGVPVGGGEDLFLFYKTLQAGFIHVYEPRAYVWHKHRREMADFRRQIHGYSQGLIAHHLLAFKNYGDWRSLLAIVTMPIYYYKRAKGQLMGQLAYPTELLVQEILGHLMGVWGLWKSRQHVHQCNKRQPFLPYRSLSQDSSVAFNSRL